MEFVSYLNENPLSELQVIFIRALAKAKLDKGIEFMTLEDLTEGELNFYTQSFGSNKALARKYCRYAFNSPNKYTDIVIEYLTTNL